MTDQYYDLTFKGDVIDGFFADFVKADLQALFKASSEKIDQWFNGSEHQIKAKVDKATAVKFQQGFKKAGAKLIVKRHNPELSVPTKGRLPANLSAVQAQSVTENIKNTAAGSSQLSTTLGATDGATTAAEIAQHQANITTPTSVPNWNVSVEGSILAQPVDQQTMDIDTSAFTLADAGANLMLSDGFESPAPVINTDNLSLAEAGTTIDILKDQQEPVTVDVSHLHIDPS